MGRWSNGPTWIEVAASLLGVSLTDYGGGGATTGSVPARKPHSSPWWGVSHASKGLCICCASIIWQLALPKSCLLAQTIFASPGPAWRRSCHMLSGVTRLRCRCLAAFGLYFTVCVPAAEVPPLPDGFANLTVPTTVLSPTLPQQLNMHFLATNNTLSAQPLYFIFIGETWPGTS